MKVTRVPFAHLLTVPLVFSWLLQEQTCRMPHTHLTLLLLFSHRQPHSLYLVISVKPPKAEVVWKWHEAAQRHSEEKCSEAEI